MAATTPNDDDDFNETDRPTDEGNQYLVFSSFTWEPLLGEEVFMCEKFFRWFFVASDVSFCDVVDLFSFCLAIYGFSLELVWDLNWFFFLKHPKDTTILFPKKKTKRARKEPSRTTQHRKCSQRRRLVTAANKKQGRRLHAKVFKYLSPLIK